MEYIKIKNFVVSYAIKRVTLKSSKRNNEDFDWGRS